MRNVAATTAAVLFAFLASSAYAQTWKPPSDDQRCPSKWGAEDQRGSANLMGPETVLRAARLIRTGEVIELGHVLSEKFHGGRRYEVYTRRTDVSAASNRPQNTYELIVSDIGQVGTQIDGFAHQAIGNAMYNCFKLDESVSGSGFKKLGIEHVGTLMTRGVLLDVARAKGMAALPDGYEITVADLKQALDKERLTLTKGDAVIIHTGFGVIYDNPRSNKGVPGLGIAAAEWLASQEPMLVGSDTGNVEVIPNPDPNLFVPVHEIMLAVHGIYLVEWLKLDELSAKQAYEFALVLEPLKMEGATGSTLAPVAIR